VEGTRQKLMAMKNPPHPGDFIRTEIIEPAGLSVTTAARALQISRPALSSLLNGNADLSGEMALRIEKGLRSDDRHTHEDAGFLRHRPDPQAGEVNPCSANSSDCQRSGITGALLRDSKFRLPVRESDPRGLGQNRTGQSPLRPRRPVCAISSPSIVQ
jgi:addiction module HigA family antidote